MSSIRSELTLLSKKVDKVVKRMEKFMRGIDLECVVEDENWQTCYFKLLSYLTRRIINPYEHVTKVLGKTYLEKDSLVMLCYIIGLGFGMCLGLS